MSNSIPVQMLTTLLLPSVVEFSALAYYRVKLSRPPAAAHKWCRCLPSQLAESGQVLVA